jgi:uncharacterized protein (TIGR00369 family)
MEGKKIGDSTVILTMIMQPQDANMAGNIHGGVIMKHIDNAAAVTSVKHAKTNIVTASIDRLSFHHPVFVGDMLTIKSSINMTGKSSMEVGVRVESENLLNGQTHHIASAYLTMVALDMHSKPTAVPPIILVTEDEIRRNGEAIDRKKTRALERIREEKHQKES